MVLVGSESVEDTLVQVIARLSLGGFQHVFDRHDAVLTLLHEQPQCRVGRKLRERKRETERERERKREREGERLNR